MDTELLKFQRVYKSIAFEDFQEDYSSFKTVRRLLVSYYKTPKKEKLHAIYNKIVTLRRVFPEGFIYLEIIKSAPNMYTRSLVVFLLNELFSSNFNVDILDDVWAEDVEELLEERKVKILKN